MAEKWEVLDSGNPSGGKVIATERSATGCRTLIARDCMAEYADLLAAAPELLVAARKILALENGDGLPAGWADGVWDLAKAVVKAEGGRA
jgi:hypothetical protein